jgi:hypothetical protein
MAYRLPLRRASAAALAAAAFAPVLAAGAHAQPPLVQPEAGWPPANECATADLDKVSDKAAFAAAILDAVHRLESFDPREAKGLLERVDLCCDLLAELEPDQRTLMAARLAYAARLMAQHDEELARELDRLVDLCGERVIDVSYGAARGAEAGSGPDLPSFFGGSGAGGGGLPSEN